MSKNFLFTSLGDNTNCHNLWIGDNMNYDVYGIYYGNDDSNYEKYKSKMKFIEKRKGSKFQNFKYFYDKYKEVIDNYDHFFILDDDIIININDINKMFEISKKHNLKICGPSFLPSSKISHHITKQNKRRSKALTYTNFVEVNVPLFNKEALQKLMKVLDPSLIGWGIDYLFIWANGINERTSYAIIHSIGVINPKDNQKTNKKREMFKVSNFSNEQNIWRNYAKKIKCPESIRTKEYSTINI